MSKILIVDDEESIRVTTKEILQKENFEVDTAPNWYTSSETKGAEDLIKEINYDVIFLDILMPKISGIEVLKKIKEVRKHTPVIMMTGQPSQKTTADAFRANAYDYLPKPIKANDLIQLAIHAKNTKQLADEKERLEKQNADFNKQLKQMLLDQVGNNTELNKIASDLISHSEQKREELDSVKDLLADALKTLDLDDEDESDDSDDGGLII